MVAFLLEFIRNPGTFTVEVSGQDPAEAILREYMGSTTRLILRTEVVFETAAAERTLLEELVAAGRALVARMPPLCKFLHFL